MIDAVAPEPVYFYLVPWQRDLFPTVSHGFSVVVCVPTHLAPGVPYLLPSRFGKGRLDRITLHSNALRGRHGGPLVIVYDYAGETRTRALVDAWSEQFTRTA